MRWGMLHRNLEGGEMVIGEAEEDLVVIEAEEVEGF